MTINDHRRPSRTAAATAVRMANGARRAAVVAAKRIRALSDEDLIALARIIDDEIEARWPAADEEPW